jgi:N4-(beta-N-acetylglucosaminyl)-L-asparaginase
MTNRRLFIKNSAIVSVGLLAACKPMREDTPSSSTRKANIPLVIATWDNRKATAAAMDTLMQGGSALDAVELGARVPEADENDTSVGYGGFPDRDGAVTLDACIMDHLGNTGAVCYLEGIKHPISVARKVMEETPHVLLCGQGALQFALSQGFQQEDLLTEKARQAWLDWAKTKQYKPVVNIERHDTIGILAIDKKGNISGACTTSGMAFKMKGRVGDSPIIGAGLFVDNEVGGAAATGQGELMIQTLGCFLVVELMRMGKSPQEACIEAVKRVVKRATAAGLTDYQAGFIAINKAGQSGAHSVVKGFNYALYQQGENQVFEASHNR